ncbi:MAG: small multi-drug export protein [Methanomicrobia archaeon]|nr:small multi-drug export protein [Methanomicrobia archaeon]
MDYLLHFRRKGKWGRVAKFFIPMIMFFIYFLIIYRLTKINSEIAPLMLAYSLPPLGKESVIPAGIALGMTPVTMFLLVFYIDMTFALLIIWNYDLIHKLPLFGEILKKIESSGIRLWNNHTWLDRLAFIGLVIFVFIPFHGTGTTTSAIIGRLIGMKPLKTFFAIMTGSITGTFFVITFSDAFMFLFGRKNLLILTLAIIIIVFLLFLRKKMRTKEKNLENYSTYPTKGRKE